MLRNKAFLIGLGCGLIAGAAFLQLMVSADEVQKKTSGTDYLTLTQEQLQLGAGRLNLKVIPKDHQAYILQQIEEIKQKAVEEEKKRVANATPVPTPTDKTVRPVFIPDHMDATSVANLLVQAQVIPEPTKLLSLLVDQKLTEKIRFGPYYFEDQTDVNEILKIITAVP